MPHDSSLSQYYYGLNTSMNVIFSYLFFIGSTIVSRIVPIIIITVSIISVNSLRPLAYSKHSFDFILSSPVKLKRRAVLFCLLIFTKSDVLIGIECTVFISKSQMIFSVSFSKIDFSLYFSYHFSLFLNSITGTILRTSHYPACDDFSCNFFVSVSSIYLFLD